MSEKKTVLLTGSSGTMGLAGFKELYAKRDKYNIVLLNRGSDKNKKLFEVYANDPCVKLVWGDLTNYDDVLEAVTGADYVSSCRRNGIPPRQTTYPLKTLKTNVSAGREHS